jgi:hypothetical protein
MEPICHPWNSHQGLHVVYLLIVCVLLGLFGFYLLRMIYKKRDR